MSQLGEALKQARNEKNISLSELSASTKIQKRYLQAVEEGQFDQLPGRFYARAFIKSYAEAVGLDPNELFEEHAGEIPTTANRDLAEQLPPRSTRARTKVGDTSKISAVLPKVLTAVMVVGLFAAFWFAFQKMSSDDAGANPPGKENGSSVEISENPDIQPEDNEKDEDKGKQGDAESKEENRENPQNQEPKPILTKTGSEGNIVYYTIKNADRFALKLKIVNASSWIEIRKSGPDGKKYVYEEVRPGKTITRDLSNYKKIYVEIGSTPHVKMSINGRPFTYPSDKTFQKFIFTFKGETVS